MSNEPKKCAHPACYCTVDKDHKYCSQYCQDSRGTMEIACNCRHAACEAGADAGTMSAQS